MDYIFPINDIVKIDSYRDSWEPIRVKKDLSEGNYTHKSIAQFNNVEKYLNKLGFLKLNLAERTPRKVL